MNLDLLQRQYDELIELKLVENLPNKDSTLLRNLIRFLKNFYVRYPPEQINNDFVVIVGDDDYTSLGIDYGLSVKNREKNIFMNIKFPAIVQLFTSGEIYYWNVCKLDIRNAPENCIIYCLNNSECIHVGHEKFSLASALNTRSYFSSPTFWDLNDALESYYNQMARKSVCRLISGSWTCERRLRWKKSPESNLRDSLWNYLRSTLRDVSEVKREQTVNAENPIDIKITWNGNYARALIEIKWLGISVNELGCITSIYANQRAIEGADQLCDYLEASFEENSELHFKGYLVVFDGRRRKVRNIEVTEVDIKDAFHYKDIEITNIPERFAKYNCILARYFIEPVCSTRGFSA